MRRLRRVLYLHALLGAIAGVFLLAAPRLTLVSLLDQPAYPDYALVRVAGIGLLVLAMLHVVVAHHAEETWWWTWAFAIEAALVGTVATLNAAVSLPRDAAAWPWWGLAILAWSSAFALLWGMRSAGQERPPGL